MSTFKRIASGSLAMWARMGVTMLSQVALVPLYLSYWPARTYGAWLALQAVYSLVTIFDTAHQSYLENHFLAIGKTDMKALRTALFSAIPTGIVLSLIQLGLLLLGKHLGWFEFLTDLNQPSDAELSHEAFTVLLVWMLVWMATLSAAGLVTRLLSALGHFSRFAWWGLAFVIASAVIPVITLVRGGSLLQVGLTQAAVTVIYNVFWFMDAIKVLRAEGITPIRPSLQTALTTLRQSTFVLFRQFLELARQHGFRMVMNPMVGLQKLAEFSTQRTVANVALQGLNSIYGPLMPELMRYIRERDQAKMEGAFALLWSLLILLLCPLIMALQLAMPVIYPIWTRGKFAFDGVLLATISASILAYMLSLPAVAVCTGNNLVKLQLRVAVFSACVLLGTLPIFIHFFDLRGAALSLLAAEAAAGLAYVRLSATWLHDAGLKWPTKGFAIALSAVAFTLLACYVTAAAPALRVPAALALLAALGMAITAYFRSLPVSTQSYVNAQVIRRFHLHRLIPSTTNTKSP
jgi:O-antigen/teichoic acid export membrane protein